MEKKKKEYILEYDMVFVNVLSAILLIFMIILTCGLVYILPDSLVGDLTSMNTSGEIDNKFMIWYVIFFVVMILWMVLHEIIHYIAYLVKGAKRENVVFGVALEKGVFYCKCKEYINKECIMTSLVSPFLIIGVITYVLGFFFSSIWLILLSIINISGAAGDLMMFHFFLKQDRDVEFKELGFSSPFVLRTSGDLINKKYLGIKSIREAKNQAEINEGPEKMITITKASWGFIVVMLALFILMLFLALF